MWFESNVKLGITLTVIILIHYVELFESNVKLGITLTLIVFILLILTFESNVKLGITLTCIPVCNKNESLRVMLN